MGLGITKTYEIDINNIKYSKLYEYCLLVHPIGMNIFTVGCSLFPLLLPIAHRHTETHGGQACPPVKLMSIIWSLIEQRTHAL